MSQDMCLEVGMNAHLAKLTDVEKIKKTIYEQAGKRKMLEENG